MSEATEQQLEVLELQFEDDVHQATIQELLELTQGFQLDTSNMTRKSQLLKQIRKYSEGAAEASTEDKILILTNLHNAFKEVKKTEERVEDNKPKIDQATGGASANNGDNLTDSLNRFVKTLSSNSFEYKRPLKIVGVIAVQDKDNKNNGISYTNLSSQIADAKATYSEDEIVREVKKAISTQSPLRTYFDTQEKLKLKQMLEMLREYYQEKDSSELFTELSKLTQRTSEKSTEFLIRALELRQKLTSAAKAEGTAYDEKLITNTFARSCRTGFQNSQVRTYMRPLFSKNPIDDDNTLLKELNIAMAECEETAMKLKNVTPRKVTINEATTSQQATETNTMADALKPLVESMILMQKELKEIKSNNNRKPTTYYKKFDGRCKQCKEKNYSNCSHCFKCGESNHMQRNCPKN